MMSKVLTNSSNSRAGRVEQVKHVTYKPAADVFETEENVVLILELPNVERENLKVFVKDGMLHIYGEKRPLRLENGAQFLVNEIKSGAYERVFELDSDLDTERISAKYDKGLLTITLWKKELEKGKRIEVR